MTWYNHTEQELRELVKDVVFRADVERRLAELRGVNAHGPRCHMSKKLEEKLVRILA